MEKVLSKRLLLTLFFVGVIVASLTLVVAQAPSDIFDPVRDMFASWDSGDISPNIAKYLFFILLAAFVWSILDTSGIVSNGIVKWIISVIVAALFNKLLIYLIGEEILKAQSQAAGSLLKRAAQMTRLDAEKFEDLAS
jgi:hypothetical protein